MLRSNGEVSCYVACPTCQKAKDPREECRLNQEHLSDGSLLIVSNYTHCNHCGYSFTQVVVSGADDVVIGKSG